MLPLAVVIFFNGDVDRVRPAAPDFETVETGEERVNRARGGDFLAVSWLLSVVGL